MKIEFILKYNASNTNKALEIIDDIRTMARNRSIDKEELEIKIEDKEVEQIEIYPTITLEKNESINSRAEKFIGDYLVALDFNSDLIVNTMRLETSE